ncbi:MAG: S41 family peptidase [Candidatus Uhrbacteria bacterium]
MNYSPTSTRHSFSRVAWPLALLLAVVTAFVVGMLFGRHQGVLSVVPEGERRVTNKSDVASTLSEDINFKTFWDVWDFAKEDYYEQPVSEQDLFYGSMKGLMSGLGDPYSVFFDPEETKEFNADLNGSFEGIGAQIDVDKNGQIVIVAPLPGSPAETQGILSGDKILAIDGLSTAGMSTEEAVSKIRGLKGTDVVLTITRDGLESAMEITITRDTIIIDSVKLEMRDDGIGVVSLYFFNEDTNALFTSAVNDLLAKGAKSIILDLRSNPGGLLDTAISVASAWTGEQTVVIQSVKGEKQAFVGSADARLAGIPTIVLVDGGSASASEIVAGALQDYGLAKLVGTQTFGKGSVQDYRELEDGSAVKLTVAEWLTPKERSINHVGIVPDFIVEYTAENAKADVDPQMDKAVEVLIGVME